MRFSQLEPSFHRYETRVEPRDFVVGDHETWRERGSPTESRVVPCQYHINVDGLADAQGVTFLCPKCFAANGGPVGTHSILVTFEGRGTDDPAWGPMVGTVRLRGGGSQALVSRTSRSPQA